MCYCKTLGLAQLALEKNVCETYFNQYLGGEALSTLVSVVITIANIIIKLVVRLLVTWIGFKTLTGDIAAFTMAVFIATFFNTAVLLLLSDANLS